MRPCIYEVTKHFFHKDFIFTLRISKIFIPTVHKRAHVPAAPYSYHSMFVAVADSAALWRCKSCGKEVSNRWHHFHSHTAQRSPCPYCPATYSRIDTLRSHLRLKHAAMLLKH
ncbi:hypothetical protein B5X24_HaOG213057 [Helicoverpa armigera]|nr:hypothetical protein B5X24_HaOG213057 [Helicoverpa armigera]